ncbi:Syntaxin-binding protein 6 [Heterocephalus glaber]|uniref:Syntaxin-binding protein 6 n=1 Tax=Heterocephalus glaber TaxID=10181 RepID=G5C1T6_HETGA|nr:Syntaxin-binding protein 6 [Heterocephalus glaber]
MLEQLRQVNGIDPNRDSAEFDLLFENAFDQWVASTASEKCTFFQILHHTCQRYLTDRKPEFINCQSKIMGGNSILHSAADSVTSAVQKASQALNERGERLGRAEEKTEDMKNSAQQFAETAHKTQEALVSGLVSPQEGLVIISGPQFWSSELEQTGIVLPARVLPASRSREWCFLRGQTHTLRIHILTNNCPFQKGKVEFLLAATI